jgi:transglutaminase/protease-like cytokinesis protein 3
MTIVANLKTFTFAHNVVVMDGDKVITATKANMKNIPEVISELAVANNCSKIILTGNKTFTKGISDKIKQCYSAKYKENNELEIECL